MHLYKKSTVTGFKREALDFINWMEKDLKYKKVDQAASLSKNDLNSIHRSLERLVNMSKQFIAFVEFVKVNHDDWSAVVKAIAI